MKLQITVYRKLFFSIAST